MKRLWRAGVPVILAILLFTTLAYSQNETAREALRQLVERAEKGDAKALYDLATLHDRGYDTIPVDSARSTLLYRLSAEKGYAPAMNYLGFRYFNGESVRHDTDSALYWLTRAAAAGDMKAANNLGFLLSQGETVTQDYEQAVYWLSKASDAGVPTAQSLLADLKREGAGTAVDTAGAVRLYTSAIEKGLGDAQLKLLSMMGRKWETLSADSAVNLGKYYYTRKAPFVGVTLFNNAAKQDNAEAYALLGEAYSQALGVDYNHNLAEENYLKGALRGNHPAEFILGELLEIFPDALNREETSAIIKEYFEGLGELLPADISSPYYWYERSAAGGITDAESAAKALFGNNAPVFQGFGR